MRAWTEVGENIRKEFILFLRAVANILVNIFFILPQLLVPKQHRNWGHSSSIFLFQITSTFSLTELPSLLIFIIISTSGKKVLQSSQNPFSSRFPPVSSALLLKIKLPAIISFSCLPLAVSNSSPSAHCGSVQQSSDHSQTRQMQNLPNPWPSFRLHPTSDFCEI